MLTAAESGDERAPRVEWIFHENASLGASEGRSSFGAVERTDIEQRCADTTLGSIYARARPKSQPAVKSRI